MCLFVYVLFSLLGVCVSVSAVCVCVWVCWASVWLTAGKHTKSGWGVGCLGENFMKFFWCHMYPSHGWGMFFLVFSITTADMNFLWFLCSIQLSIWRQGGRTQGDDCLRKIEWISNALVVAQTCSEARAKHYELNETMQEARTAREHYQQANKTSNRDKVIQKILVIAMTLSSVFMMFHDVLVLLLCWYVLILLCWCMCCWCWVVCVELV